MAQEKDKAFPPVLNKLRAFAIKSCLKKNLLRVIIDEPDWNQKNKKKSCLSFWDCCTAKKSTNLNKNLKKKTKQKTVIVLDFK